MKNLFNQVDLNDAKAAIIVWLDELVKTYHFSAGYSLKVKIYDDFKELNKEMTQDSLAIVAMNTTDYLKNYEKTGLDPVLVPSAEGDIFAQYYMLVRKDDSYKNINDLKGTSIGILSGTNQAASTCWLDVTLAKNNIPDKTKFFKKIISENKESQLILNLFFGQLDACIVSKGGFSVMKELNPQVGEKLISIEISPKYLWGVVCFTKTFVNPGDRDLFYTHALKIQELISGKQVLSLIKVDKLQTFKYDYLNSFKDLLKEYTYFLKTKRINSYDQNQYNNRPN
jgi:phosphonate transport system substrate-binding protein